MVAHKTNFIVVGHKLSNERTLLEDGCKIDEVVGGNHNMVTILIKITLEVKTEQRYSTMTPKLLLFNLWKRLEGCGKAK